MVLDLATMRLFLKFLYPAVLVHLKGTIAFHISADRHVLAHHRNIGLFLNMVFQNLVIIHFINTVTGRNYHIRLMAALQERQVLINSVCGSSVPIAVVRRNRRGENEHDRPVYVRNPTIWKNSDAHSGFSHCTE